MKKLAWKVFWLPLISLLAVFGCESAGAQVNGGVFSPAPTLSTIVGTLGKAKGGTGATTGRAAASNLSLPYVLSNTNTSVSHTGDTVEAILGYVNVPANAAGANGCVELDAVFGITGSAGTWVLGVRVITGTVAGTTGGTSLASQTIAAGGNQRASLLICNNNATNSQFMYAGSASFTASSSLINTSAIDTTAAWTISVNGKLNAAADTVALRHLHSLLIATAGN